MWLLALGIAFWAGTPDFQLFVKQVQPIFLKQRKGAGRCYDCHSLKTHSSAFRLQPLPPEERWSQEQSRRNYENVLLLVNVEQPLESRLLRHPLAREAGGDTFHSGGKFWRSQKDPEFQKIYRWITSAKPRLRQ